VHTSQVDDKDEYALLVANTKVHTELAPLSQTEVHLNGDKLFVHLGDKEGGTRVGYYTLAPPIT
jgi:hypothetical protein